MRKEKRIELFTSRSVVELQDDVNEFLDGIDEDDFESVTYSPYYTDLRSPSGLPQVYYTASVIFVVEIHGDEE